MNKESSVTKSILAACDNIPTAQPPANTIANTTVNTTATPTHRTSAGISHAARSAKQHHDDRDRQKQHRE